MAWFTYTLQRLNFAFQKGYRLGTQGTPFQMISKTFMGEIDAVLMQKGMTEVILLTGIAMCPTLNTKAEKDRNAVDHLLLRLIPVPSARNCHVGDVVAFENPYSLGRQRSLLVRRIAAMPGDQMLSDSINFEPFIIPHGHCWVLADNEKCRGNEVEDSRFFGPVPLDNIRGRVIYNGYDKHDHGAVQNSPQASRPDEILLKYELDISRLFSDMK